jgi:hypothetical protein
MIKSLSAEEELKDSFYYIVYLNQDQPDNILHKM